MSNKVKNIFGPLFAIFGDVKIRVNFRQQNQGVGAVKPGGYRTYRGIC